MWDQVYKIVQTEYKIKIHFFNVETAFGVGAACLQLPKFELHITKKGRVYKIRDLVYKIVQNEYKIVQNEYKIMIQFFMLKLHLAWGGEAACDQAPTFFYLIFFFFISINFFTVFWRFFQQLQTFLESIQKFLKYLNLRGITKKILQYFAKFMEILLGKFNENPAHTITKLQFSVSVLAPSTLILYGSPPFLKILHTK